MTDEEYNNLDHKRIQPLMTELKKIYCKHKSSKYTPNLQSRSSDRKTWARMACLVEELGADPENFIAATFDNCKASAGPFPTSFLGPTAVKNYHKFMGVKEMRTAEEYREVQPGENVFEAEPSDMFKNLPAAKEIKMLIEMVLSTLYRMHGSSEITDKAINTMCIDAYGFSPLACMIIASFDDRVRNKYSEDAKKFVDKNPHIARSLRDLDIQIQWTS